MSEYKMNSREIPGDSPVADPWEQDQLYKILTIDDEAFIRQSIRTYLEDYGFIVFEAENGREGIAVFEREEPDLVVLDLRMPQMGGLEVLDVLNSKAPDTPLVVASGAGAEARVVMGVALLGGMALATMLGVFFYPMLFVFIGKIAGYEKKRDLQKEQR